MHCVPHSHTQVARVGLSYARMCMLRMRHLIYSLLNSLSHGLQDFIDALTKKASADQAKASSKATGKVEFTRPSTSGTAAASAVAATLAAGFPRAQVTVGGVSVASMVAKGKATAESKERDRKRERWDSKAARK